MYVRKHNLPSKNRLNRNRISILKPENNLFFSPGSNLSAKSIPLIDSRANKWADKIGVSFEGTLQKTRLPGEYALLKMIES